MDSHLCRFPGASFVILSGISPARAIETGVPLTQNSPAGLGFNLLPHSPPFMTCCLVVIFAMALWIYRLKNQCATLRQSAINHQKEMADIEADLAQRPTHCDIEKQDRHITHLQKTRDDLRNLLNHIPFPVWIRNRDLNLTFCNHAYGQAVACPPQEALEKGLEIHINKTGTRERALAERVRATHATQSESGHLVIDQKRRFMEFVEKPFLDIENNIHQIFGWGRDLTEAESVRDDLERHINAHGKVLEDLHIAIAIFGPDRKLKFFNSSYLKLWKLDLEWLQEEPEIGQILDQLREKRLLPEVIDFQGFKNETRALFTSLIELRKDLMHLPNDRTVCASMAPHPLGGILFIYEDVTDRLALERSYHTLNATQRETLNNLYEGIAVFGNDGRLKLSNPAFAAIWRLPLPLLKTRPHIQKLAEKFCEQFPEKENRESMRVGLIGAVTNPACREGRFLRKDGSSIDYVSVPLPDGSTLLTYRDVTDRLRAERALREKAEAMEMMARMKSKFIANISYELRTPLNSIIGFSELLEQQYFGKLNRRQKEYNQGILDASRQLTLLIDDILDMAQIEAGYLHLERNFMVLPEFLKECLSLVREKAAEHNITIKTRIADHLPELYADSRRLSQAIFNLLDNAIRFTPPKGWIELTASQNKNSVQIAIKDNGIGIPREDQARILEKFEKAANNQPLKGSGLGLPLTKALTELHGGSLSLESELDQGTIVTMRFPIESKPLLSIAS